MRNFMCAFRFSQFVSRFFSSSGFELRLNLSYLCHFDAGRCVTKATFIIGN